MSRQRNQNAEVRLDSEQFPELNQRFYVADPASYFRARLQSLLLMAARPDQLAQLFSEGIEYGSIRASLADSPLIETESGRVLDSYVTAESEVLLHHAAEALMRIFLAHRGRPQCPWLEIARLRVPAAFKRHIGEL